MTTRHLSEIIVSSRHRTELGDIDGLAESIDTLGLIQPIAITPDGRLLAGQRRLAACEKLGWERIPVHVLSNLEEARDRLFAERDENTCRLDMTISEKVSLGMALEELERPRAKERQGTRNDLVKHSDNVPECSLPPVREQVGAAVGMSGTTYQRAKAVIEAAADEALPEAVRQIAIGAKQEMDESGKVTGAYNRVAAAVGNRNGKKSKSKKEPPRQSPTNGKMVLSDFWKKFQALELATKEPPNEQWMPWPTKQMRIRIIRRVIARLEAVIAVYSDGGVNGPDGTS